MVTKIKKLNKKDNKYFYWGLFFLSIQILAIIRNLLSGYVTFFWYCDFSSGVFAILFFLRANQAIKGLLNIGLFGQIGYVFIFMFKLLFGITLLGFVFNFAGPFYIVVTLIIHLSSILALIAVYRVKPTKHSLLYSLLFLVIMYLAILTFTVPSTKIGYNFNYIYYSQTVSPHVLYYTQLWIPLAFVITVIPTYLFQILIYYLYKNKAKVY